MTTSGEDWIAVLDRLAAGDRLAFAKVNRLISGFLVQLHAYDFRDEWDDLRQEVLIAVVENARAGRLRDPQAFLGYVRAIVRNKLVDRLKAQLRCPTDGALPWDDETARAVDAASTDGAAHDVWRVAEELPPEERAVLEAIYRSGQTYEEASRATGIPLGTMKRRLRDGLAFLRRRLAGDFG